jgi:hypothetical protein
MQPLKLTVSGSYWDSFIYAGRLYLFGTDGSIHCVDWDALVSTWNLNARLKLAFDCAFRRSDYLYGNDLAALVHDEEIHRAIASKFSDLAHEELVVNRDTLRLHETGAQDNPCPFPHADIDIYQSRLYVASSDGLTQTNCNKKTRGPVSSKPMRLWDAPILSLAASQQTLAIAAGNEGLYEYKLEGESYWHKESTAGPKILSGLPCRDCNWNYYSIFASSDDAGYLAGFTRWEDGKYQRGRRASFEKIQTADELFGNRGYAWGVQDKICQAIPNGVRVLKYEPWLENPEERVRSLATLQFQPWKGEILSASVASFGIIVELERALVVYTSDNQYHTFPGELTNWRTFQRSKHYENQLHLIYEDRLEVLSFNHDYLIPQEEKVAGTRVSLFTPGRRFSAVT